MTELHVLVGKDKTTKHWTPHKPMPWSEFTEWLCARTTGGEKHVLPYMVGEIAKTERECCTGWHRTRAAVLWRDALTLDADYATPALVDTLELVFGWTCVVHETASSTPAAPRYRVIIQTDRSMTPVEYWTVARVAMRLLGREQFDLSSDQPERCMYPPTTNDAGWREVDGRPLQVDGLLMLATDEELKVAPAGSAVSAADVDAFCNEHVSNDFPALMAAPLKQFASRAATGSRHNALVPAACWLAREASVGAYPARAAFDALEAAWDAAWSEPRGAGERADPQPGEFHDVVERAVAQALAGDRTALRAKVQAAAGGPIADFGAPSAVLAVPRSKARAGDLFNTDDSRETLAGLMEKLGWRVLDDDKLARPGGTEAAAVIKDRKLHVLRGDPAVAPLVPGRVYDKFQVYAITHHQGDFKVAARALWDQGWVNTGAMKLLKPAEATVGVNCDRLIQAYTLASGCWSLRCMDKRFIEYVGTHYVERSDAQVKAILARRLENAVIGDGQPCPVYPALLDTYASMFKTMTHVSDDVELDSWDTCDAASCELAEVDARYVSVFNGLLNIETGEVAPHNPAFLTLNSIPFVFDRDAAEPGLVLATLRQQFPGDEESVLAFQEHAGYMVFGTNADNLAAIVALLGQTGAGKSMWARVLTTLVGPANVASPTVETLGTNFGKQGVIGKRAVIMSDAHVNAGSGATEYLKAASGNDRVGFDRKNRDHYEGCIPAPHMLVSNGVPRFNDATGVIAKRIYPLWFTVQFRGEGDENKNLDADIIGKEATELLAWLWRGYRRAIGRGALVRVETEQVTEVNDMITSATAPFMAWLQEKCEVRPGVQMEPQAGFESYLEWTYEQSLPSPSMKAFAMSLKEAVPSVVMKKNDGRRAYEGVHLK